MSGNPSNGHEPHEKSSRLHELLAVRRNIQLQTHTVRTDLLNTFEKKKHIFEEKKAVRQSNEEGVEATVESQGAIQSTIAEELKWIGEHIAKNLDINYQVDLANMLAVADIVDEDGRVLATAVPATNLLQLEKRVAELKELVAATPTLDPAQAFELDPARGVGYYKAREVVKPWTQKKRVPLVKFQATKEHPAQVEVYDDMVLVGKITEQLWSGLITTAKKAVLLDRVEKLLRAVSKARSRANEASINVADKKIGAALIGYVLDPLELP